MAEHSSIKELNYSQDWFTMNHHEWFTRRGGNHHEWLNYEQNVPCDISCL